MGTDKQANLFSVNPQFFPKEDEYMLHSHCFVSGPRSGGAYRNGKWDDGRITHSHPGGSIPHTHAHTGPSNYGYRHKATKKPKGEQGLEVIPRTEEENTFELIVTDSALVSFPAPMGSKIQPLQPIGDTPLEALGLTPAADRMVNTFGMKCIVRDERKLARR